MRAHCERLACGSGNAAGESSMVLVGRVLEELRVVERLAFLLVFEALHRLIVGVEELVGLHFDGEGSCELGTRRLASCGSGNAAAG